MHKQVKSGPKNMTGALAGAGRACRPSPGTTNVYLPFRKADHKVHIKRGVIVCSAGAVPDNAGRERKRTLGDGTAFFQRFLVTIRFYFEQ